MSRTLRVNILDREYVLRVERDEDARLTQEIARYVDGKMRAFRRSHPDRPELTTAVIAALAIAEDLYSERDRAQQLLEALEHTADEVSSEIDHVLHQDV